MKVFVCALVLAVAAMTGASRSVSAQSVDPILQKAMDARRAARPAKDLDTWPRLTADDAMEIHSDGRVHTKTEEIAEVKAGNAAGAP